MATTSCEFLALPVTEAVATQYQITVGFNTETWTSPGTGTALELAADLVTWANAGARSWAPGKTFYATWEAGTAGARMTLHMNFNFDLTKLAGDNALQLANCAGVPSTASSADVSGTWIALLMRLPPLWAKVGEASSPRALGLGGPVRADATAGTTVKAATLQAFCNGRQLLRLTDLIANCIGGTARATYAAMSGSETDLIWDVPESTFMDAVATVTMPIRQEV